MSKTDIPYDVLAQRYASAEMVAIWGERYKIILERRLWIAIMKAQAKQGYSIPEEAIAKYESVAEIIDLDSIRRREERLRHDVMARIEEFNALAGHEFVHIGMTSRDLTDNVEQWQIRQALQLVHGRTVAMLARFARVSAQYATLDICGRSHLMPGQTTTLGKRFSVFAETLYRGFFQLESLIHAYPLRGIKGAMGTQQDMAEIVNDPAMLEAEVRKMLGFTHVLTSTGQVYPRVLDYHVASQLVQLADAPANFAWLVRTMAGQGHLHEGFGAGQKGSSAMPHKRNARTSERVKALLIVLRGYASMLSALLGEQTCEGDVSCSVVRRVALPGVFYALDGIYESAMTVLDEMEVFPHSIAKELRVYLPLLSTTRVLMEAVKRGVGRETAHAVIREHSLAALEAMQTSDGDHGLADRLGGDARLKLSREEVHELMLTPNHGRAQEQAEAVVAKVAALVRQYPEKAAYIPAKIV